MRRMTARAFLGVCGALLLCIGIAVLFQPESFAAANGVALADDPNMRSEYRAPGGMLVASGVLILLGAVRERHTRAAYGLAALVYGSYGVARLVGMGADGLPSAALTQAMVIELLVASICLFVLVRAKRAPIAEGAQ